MAVVRAKVDYRNEKIGKKIRDAQLEKVPYMLIVGDKEVESGEVNVRHRAEGDLGNMSVAACAEMVAEVIRTRAKK